MFIDIHVHAQRVPGPPRSGDRDFSSPEWLIERYDKIRVEKAVLLPLVSPECRYTLTTTEDNLEIAERYPDRFIPFCNVDPRAMTDRPDAPLDQILSYYKERGCRGVGEVTANLRFDDPRVENLFSHCQSLGLPVTFHVSPTIGGNYGLYDEPGLPLLEQALAKFPDLIFLGHSQAFWIEIAPPDPSVSRNSYPTAPITSEGAVQRLMRNYPNLHGDLSAGSGYNALARDLDHATSFLNEFQDRLYFGTDICAPDTPTPLVDLLKTMRKERRISRTVFDKIARRNAIRLLGL